MEYPFNTLYEIAQQQAKNRGGKTALFVDEAKIRYRDILQKADVLAGVLAKKGVKQGDRVALFLRNSPEFVYAIFAVSKLGKVVNASNASQVCSSIFWEGEAETVNQNDICFDAVWKENAAEAVYAEGTLDDTAVLIYTSGTTGKPKGAMLSNRNILSNADSGRQTIRVTHKDRVIVFLPMFHSFTFSIGVILPLYVGASIVIIKSIQPFSNIFKQTLMKRVTIFFGVPDVYNALARAKLPWYFMWFNRVRAFISGAAPLQPKTLDAMAQKFKRATLLEGYGLSEASPAVCINTFKKQKAGSVGTALPHYCQR